MQPMLVIVLTMTASNRQLTDSDLNHAGKAEDPPCSQRGDGSRRAGGTRRARRPRAPAHWEVSVREEQRDLCRAGLERSGPVFVPVFLSPVRCLAVSNCKFSSLKRQTTLLAHYHSSHFNSTKTFCLSLNSL